MLVKYVFTLVVLLMSVSIVSAQQLSTLECQYKEGICDVGAGEKTLFYANQNLSSNVRIYHSSFPYNPSYVYSVCCKSPFGEIAFTTVEKDLSCPYGGEELMYFTDATNSRVAFDYNPLHHDYKLCAEIPDEFSSLDILINDSIDYSLLGYTCLYRTSDVENGHVSSCDATFGLSNIYKYTVWARMWESLDTLKCSADCTSVLDGRVRVACSQKIRECEGIPLSCDGSLPGGWVTNLLNTSQEIQCSAPWDIVRNKVFTDETISVTTKTGECSNIIKNEQTVLLDNIPVSLTIYWCSD